MEAAHLGLSKSDPGRVDWCSDQGIEFGNHALSGVEHLGLVVKELYEHESRVLDVERGVPVLSDR